MIQILHQDLKQTLSSICSAYEITFLLLKKGEDAF